MLNLKNLHNSSLIRSLLGAVAGSTRPARDWIRARFLVQLLGRTIKEMSADDATHMAAGISYYGLFSIFPLLLFLISVFSLTMEPDDIRVRLTELSAGYFPGSQQLIDNNLDAVLRARGALGLFGVLGLLWSGSAVFGALSRSINRAWDVQVDRPFFISKPRQLAMAAGIAILFTVSLSVVSVARSVNGLMDGGLFGPPSVSGWLIPGLLQVISLALTGGMFLLMYKFMPNTKTYWRFIWPGAITGAILFELSENLFVVYLARFANFEDVYGALAPVIVLSLWTYISGLILIFGAELSSEYGRLRRGVQRGVLLYPQTPVGDEAGDEVGNEAETGPKGGQ